MQFCDTAEYNSALLQNHVRSWPGSCFSFCMSNAALCKKHILVVDDEPLICDTVKMILQLDGHLVDSASSGAQALDLFEPGKFDVIITDFFMPAMTGEKL